MKILQTIFIYMIRILLCLLLVIFGYDKLNNETFIEEIAQYEVFHQQLVSLIATILPLIEILIGFLILLPSALHPKLIFPKKIRYVTHAFYFLLMFSFLLILIKGKMIGINDCGCGISLNPLDILAKQLWTLYSGEIIVGMNASILRNIIAMFLLLLSSFSIYKNNT